MCTNKFPTYCTQYYGHYFFFFFFTFGALFFFSVFLTCMMHTFLWGVQREIIIYVIILASFFWFSTMSSLKILFCKGTAAGALHFVARCLLTTLVSDNYKYICIIKLQILEITKSKIVTQNAAKYRQCTDNSYCLHSETAKYLVFFL